MVWRIVGNWLGGQAIEQVRMVDVGNVRADVTLIGGTIGRHWSISEPTPGLLSATIDGATLTLAPSTGMEPNVPGRLDDLAVLLVSIPATVQVAGESSVTLVGAVDHLNLGVFDGAAVDATDLQVQRLTVTLEQSTATVRPAQSVAGWVAYGATLTV